MTATDDVTLDLLAYLCELHRRLGEPQLRRGHNIVRLTTFYDDENFTVVRIHLDSGRLFITKKRRWPFRIVMSRHDERMIDEADRVALVRDIQALKMDPKPSGGGLDGTTWALEIAAGVSGRATLASVR